MKGVQQVLHHFLQPHQVDELIVGCRGQEAELGRGGLGWGNLQESLLQLLTQSELGCSLAAGGRVVHADHRYAAVSRGRALQARGRGLPNQSGESKAGYTQGSDQDILPWSNASIFMRVTSTNVPVSSQKTALHGSWEIVPLGHVKVMLAS